MAKARKTARKTARKRSMGKGRAAASDAISLLKSDHRQVESWFEEFRVRAR